MSYDNVKKQIVYQVSINMTTVVQQCGGVRGAFAVNTATGTTYTIPLSYVEQRIGNIFVPNTRLFTVDVTTTGVITIGAAAQFRYEANSIEVTYPQASCPAGSALQRISQNVVISDVFESNLVVAPQSINSLLQRSPLAAGNTVVNCYGDTVTQYAFVGCNRQLFTCTYSFTTQSRCRVLTSDGQAFATCAGAAASDRIADMGSNIPYPTSLDGLHRTYAYHQACVGSACTNTSQSALGGPDEIRTFVSTSVFQPTNIAVNPFQVQGGFLPFPTADATQFRQLTNQVSTPGAVSTFDGNVFSRQPVTVAVLLPASLRQQFDLRVLINAGNTTIYPLDTNGNRVLTSVPSSLDYSAVRNALLYTTKATQSQCPAGDVCNTLPACNGILGCDGFSVPVAQLVSLMPANGYGFETSYRVNLPGQPIATRRRLLAEDPESTSDPNDGRVYFRIRINEDGTVTIDQFSVAVHNRSFVEAFFMALALVIVSAIALYFVVSRVQYSTTKTKYKHMGI